MLLQLVVDLLTTPKTEDKHNAKVNSTKSWSI